MTVHLRKLIPQDVPRIAELERQLFGIGAWSPTMIAEELSGFGRWYVVAEDDNCAVTTPNGTVAVGLPQVVGYAGLWFDGEVTQVMTLGVDALRRRSGIGRLMLEALIAQSMRLGATEMFLEVAVNNLAALALYRSYGFLPLGIRKRYYPDNTNAYTMRLQLT